MQSSRRVGAPRQPHPSWHVESVPACTVSHHRRLIQACRLQQPRPAECQAQTKSVFQMSLSTSISKQKCHSKADHTRDLHCLNRTQYRCGSELSYHVGFASSKQAQSLRGQSNSTKSAHQFRPKRSLVKTRPCTRCRDDRAPLYSSHLAPKGLGLNKTAWKS